MWLLMLIQIVIIAACVGFLYREGMWGNFIRFVNVLFAAVLATNFFEPLARILEELISPKLTYFYDFLAFWLVYAVSFLVLHVATAAASRVKVRFNHYLNMGGGIFLALVIGLTMCSVLKFSLHLAPLGTKPFLASVVDEDGDPLGAQWAGIMRGLSSGVFSRSVAAEAEGIYGGSVAKFPGAKNIFEVYLERAEALEAQVNNGGGFTTEGAPPR
ncbi:MAG: CvpA family protein [Thermogutta sp.]